MESRAKKKRIAGTLEPDEAPDPILIGQESGDAASLDVREAAAPSQGQDSRGAAEPPKTTFGVQPCACNQPWCGVDLTGEPCHKVPSGADIAVGRQWLRRVGPSSGPNGKHYRSITPAIDARLLNPNCTLKLHRYHFFDVDLVRYPTSSRVNISSDFNKDPRFRSYTQIKDRVLAPRTYTHPTQALPPQSVRPATSIALSAYLQRPFLHLQRPSSAATDATSPVRSPTTSKSKSSPPTPRSPLPPPTSAPPPKIRRSSSSSLGTSSAPSFSSAPARVPVSVDASASTRKQATADHERKTNPSLFERNELAEKLLAAESKLLLFSKSTEELEARIAQLEISSQGKTLSWDTLKSAPFVDSLKAFTGFASSEIMESFYDLLNCDGACDRLDLYRDPEHSLSVTEAERLRRAVETRGARRALTPRDGLALTLFMLRSGETFTVAGPLFGVDRITASRHFVTWVMTLEVFLTAEFPYPTVEQLDRVTPGSVREAMNMAMAGTHFEAFIDCHEQPCEDPSSKLGHKKVFSTYKGCPTFKFFGAVAGNGAFTFASTAFRGRLTDPVVTRLCGYLDVIHPGGLTGADKGFDMIADFSAKKAILVIPPKAFNGQKIYTQDEMMDTAKIARVRIHVERAFKRAQEYKILHNKIPVTMFDIWGSIFRVCCLLTNFEPPLISDK